MCHTKPVNRIVYQMLLKLFVIKNKIFSVSTILRVGHNEVIGVCRTGIDAEGLGRDHWNEMLAYPRKPITHWHPLVEVRSSKIFSLTLSVLVPHIYGLLRIMKISAAPTDQVEGH